MWKKIELKVIQGLNSDIRFTPVIDNCVTDLFRI